MARAYAEARVNRTYAPRTPLETILRDVARAFGVALPEVSEELRGRVAAGEAIMGYASDELTRLLAPFGYEWSFQDGRLQILRFDQARAGVIRVISQDDGMIETVWATDGEVVGDAWSDFIPESAKLTADWTYPWVCGNCEAPKYIK